MGIRRLLSALMDVPFPHSVKCERKLRRLVVERGARLEKRGMTRANAHEQARDELVRFIELLNLDPDWLGDLGFAEDQFPSYTRSLDKNVRVTRESLLRFVRPPRRGASGWHL